MSAFEELVWQVREAGTCLLCANGNNCSSPVDCFRWAKGHIAEANEILNTGLPLVTVFEQGPGRIIEVTNEAQLLVALDSGGSTTVSSFDVQEATS